MDLYISKPLYDFFERLDRAYFIEGESKAYAKHDVALSIGYGATISQPTLVLQMTQLLELGKKHNVLEIGTGSGYQTAFLAEFGGEVYSVELIEALSVKARERIENLGYKNAMFKVGDGTQGWKEYAPYDRIIVTAGGSQVPPMLVEQLSPGGRMVIPVGPRISQQMLLIEKDERGHVKQYSLGEVRFVELKGKYGWES